MGPEVPLILLVVTIAWSLAVVLAVGTALLSRDPRQRSDAREVLLHLLRSRELRGKRDE